MEFKKTDTAELQKTMTIVVCAIMVLIPIVTFVQKWTDLLGEFTSRVNMAEPIIIVGAAILLMLCVMYWRLKENRYFT